MSVVLRDSEEIEDHDLKKQVLTEVLKGWGHVSDTMYEDPAYQELIDVLREQVRDLEDDATDTGIDTVARMLPDLLMYSSIQSSLASRKLLMSARDVASAADVRDDPRAAIPAVILLERIDEPGWEKTFADLIGPYESTDIVEDFVMGIAFARFVQAPRNSALENSLRELIARAYLAPLRFESNAHRSAVKAALLTRLNTAKVSALPRLPELSTI